MPIQTPTVLVLGAGASADFRFPLGYQLRDRVLQYCRQKDGRELLANFAHEREIDQFYAELRYSNLRSVDAFLEKNTEFMTLGKHAIAAVLLPSESEEYLFPPQAPQEHWYSLLADRLGYEHEQWALNQLSIITFNYDRSLEHFLTKVLAQRRRIKDSDVAYSVVRSLTIVHVHGMLGAYTESAPDGDEALPYGAQVNARNVSAAAGRVLVVSEATDTLPTFDRAHALLSSAKRIYFLGFGFHHDNVRRLRYFQHGPQSDVIVSGTVQGFLEADWRRILEGSLNGCWNGPQASQVSDFVNRLAVLD